MSAAAPWLHLSRWRSIKPRQGGWLVVNESGGLAPTPFSFGEDEGKRAQQRADDLNAAEASIVVNRLST